MGLRADLKSFTERLIWDGLWRWDYMTCWWAGQMGVFHRGGKSCANAKRHSGSQSWLYMGITWSALNKLCLCWGLPLPSQILAIGKGSTGAQSRSSSPLQVHWVSISEAGVETVIFIYFFKLFYYAELKDMWLFVQWVEKRHWGSGCELGR